MFVSYITGLRILVAHYSCGSDKIPQISFEKLWCWHKLWWQCELETSSKDQNWQHQATMYFEIQLVSPLEYKICLYACFINQEQETLLHAIQLFTSSFIFHLMTSQLIRKKFVQAINLVFQSFSNIQELKIQHYETQLSLKALTIMKLSCSWWV